MDIPASTSQWGDIVTYLDLTEMVKAMVNKANVNNGFCIMHQVEDFYRSVSFASSDHPDTT